MTKQRAQRGHENAQAADMPSSTPSEAQRPTTAFLVDDRWRTLMIGVMADGSQCPSGLADRIYDPLTDIACRMVHGLRVYDAVAPLSERDRELLIASDREVDALEQLEYELETVIQERVKTFALGILELREPVR